MNAWRQRKGALAGPLAGFVLCAALLGCGASGEQVHSPVSAQEAEQVDLLSRLEQKWAVASRSERLAMEKELQQFIEGYPPSEFTQRAQLMKSWISVEKGELEQAKAELAQLPALQGKAADEKQLLLGKIARAENDPEKSLEYLTPLTDKLLTDESSREHAAELVQAAIAARRYRLAVDAMATQVELERKRNPQIASQLDKDIRAIPAHVLLRIVSDYYQGDLQSREELMRVIVEYLARRAINESDPRLARDLLSASPTWLRAGRYGDELAHLAFLVTESARVSGRTVGIVLGGDSGEASRTDLRSIQAALGLSKALREEGESSVRLVAAENRGSVAAALGALTGMGASILVAGVQERQAEEALRFANQSQVPVILLTPPPAGTKLGNFAFVLGESEERELDEMVRLSGKPADVFFKVDTRSLCKDQLTRREQMRAAIDQWRKDEHFNLAFFGSDNCMRTLERELVDAKFFPTLFLGVESSLVRLTRVSAYRLATGKWYRPLAEFSFEYSEEEQGSYERPSTWYYSLGQDAAALCRAALEKLPDDVAVDEEMVQKRHQMAREALRSVQVNLSTTSARGFSKNQRVMREFSLEQLSKNDNSF